MTGRRTSACALALVLVAGAGGLPSAPATATAPQVTVAPAAGSVGASVTVTLTGWPTGIVQLEICGNQARRGALDCATGAARQLYVADPQPLAARLAVAAPPVACPCVVRARTLTPEAVDEAVDEAATVAVTGTAPIDLTDLTAPVAPTGPGRAGLRLAGLSVVPAARDWATLLALRGEIVIDIDLRNDGTVEAGEAQLSLLTGRPGRPTSVVEATDVAPLPAGQGTTVRIVVPVDGPLYGRYAVQGRLTTMDTVGDTDAVVFEVQTERYPWGWAALAGMLILGLLVRQAVCWRRDRRPAS
ncbi:hypothetical protein O7623_15095 [Solwaraspora sp. WMMD791]|uniref:hypothetical protein n=1 Tax=Solwaraspora sp. WMMD791 TaxID=3016086 RepID=UPI00249C4951|nr:hypothetical protein [Solwaraspora sp. WMMD791]WFE30425.1 hypothetical protein O7623_15095 [Solwaraspora sp. WMMD791]